MKPQPVPEIFSLARRRHLDDDKVRVHRKAQAHAKRIAAAIAREKRFLEATAAIADAEFSAADAVAEIIASAGRTEPDPQHGGTQGSARGEGRGTNGHATNGRARRVERGA